MMPRPAGRLVVLVASASVLMLVAGCSGNVRSVDGPANELVADGGNHVAASALSKSPRVADGALTLSLDEAKKRAKFSLRIPKATEVPEDSVAVRVLPQGSDAGEGYYVQFKKYEVAQMPTDVRFDSQSYTTQRFMRDLSDPQSEFARYRAVKVGPYDGVVGAEFAQVQGAETIANVPAIVAWQVPAPAGSGAEYLNITVSAWDMDEDKLLRIAESLN